VANRSAPRRPADNITNTTENTPHLQRISPWIWPGNGRIMANSEDFVVNKFARSAVLMAGIQSSTEHFDEKLMSMLAHVFFSLMQ
jgi:hypothetical protein